MATHKSFGQQRVEAMGDWARKVVVPGMDQVTFVAIFNYVLAEQQPGGFWWEEGHNWNVVMTGVVLKSLAALRFKKGDRWPIQGGEGGIDLGVGFLTNEVARPDGRPEAVGEDIWDACQAALALAEFGPFPATKQMVRRINADWRNLYRSACEAAEGNIWAGPAYLAAMVDVMGGYEKLLGKDSGFAQAIEKLKGLAVQDPEGRTRFPATAPRDDMDLWTTSLVLRTLCTVQPGRQALVDRDQIQRITHWLLDRLAAKFWKKEAGMAPMLCARCLHGLRAAREWVDGPTRQRIEDAVEGGNKELAAFFGQQPVRLGGLKAYTAVVEYLADWMVPTPAGLLFHVARDLSDSVTARPEPQPRPGGLRIAWLSDLHVAAEDPTVPGSFNLLKRWAGTFMRFKGTPLTEHFQLRNVRTILERLTIDRPGHILITGDLTNYAQESQFRSLHDQLLSVQRSLLPADGSARSSTDGKLDPALWTILPGNHDVTDERACADPVRYNLGMFFNWFGSTYLPALTLTGYDNAFPMTKPLKTRDDAFSVRLIGLDSTVPAPVWRVGVNARGRIDAGQLTRLRDLFSAPAPHQITLVALHHHPIVVPELVSAVEDYFLGLKEGDGRDLVKLCANNGVSAILHGHFHHFSSWSGLTPTGGQMSIIGSAAGTVNLPGTSEEYLELREAERETATGVEQGLAVYTHRHVHDGSWAVSYTGIFLPCA
jgi:3',5'-cyclic AMP phosphodiesterase CpdA